MTKNFTIKTVRSGRPNIIADKEYEVLGMTGSLNDTAFFIADETGKMTFIKLGDAYVGSIGEQSIADANNSLPEAIMDAIEALKTKVASLQGQINALKAKKAE